MEVQFGSDGIPFVTWGGNKIMLELDPIEDAECKEKAEKELRETPEVVEKALIELRQLLRRYGSDSRSCNETIRKTGEVVREKDVAHKPKHVPQYCVSRRTTLT
ncbi:hypothetical protein B5X24_HaOG213283 [Helicoverpa armigera]|nr:hypothetical protein B5X24_HaOG213283 [Helicoverpa armigera]